MATFVLVHDAWHGAWCWRRVARLLARNRYEVFTPTLTGLGERSHLLTPDINLDIHILDVVNEMKWQELNHVVLVGHSYGGMVISGVAEKMEKSISSFVMVDAFLSETGQALIDLQPPIGPRHFTVGGTQWRNNLSATVRCLF
jgi:pimeloyl-ACP methyl ester carboxylesterase